MIGNRDGKSLTGNHSGNTLDLVNRDGNWLQDIMVWNREETLAKIFFFK